MRPVLLGCAFGVLLWLLALFCTGGGHGTYLPIAVFGAPLPDPVTREVPREPVRGWAASP